MTVNPLVAAGVDAPDDAWAGVWAAEDIELLKQGVDNGSWVDASLGVVGATLDGLALMTDPAGVLLQYGISWIIEHVKPLTEALDQLAGDPGQIAAHAQTWRNVAASLHDNAQHLGSVVRNDVTDWTGTAGDAYRAWSKRQQDAVVGLAKGAEAMAAITEGAGFLIAAVRLLVRDAIATLVSRLIVYAAEEAATFGLATPLVAAQVTTLVASWAAKIARWLKALLASLRNLLPIIRRLGELIEELKRILNRLGRHGDGPPKRPPGNQTRQDLLDELQRLGVKHNPDDIIEIGKNDAGQIIFLEKGNGRAGLEHIRQRHGPDFANIGIPEEKIPSLVFSAATTGRPAGMQGNRPIFEVFFEGKAYKMAITIGDNGFIVGANPVGR